MYSNTNITRSYMHHVNTTDKNIHLLDEDTCSVSLPCAKYPESGIVPTTVEISLPNKTRYY